jgi:hypothetical protein
VIGGLKSGGEGLAALQEEGRDAATAKVGEGGVDPVGDQDLSPGAA